MHAFKPKTIYLTLAESRRWSVDHPVGDPFGGAAYGEKRMPAVAVVGMAIGMEIGITTLVGGLTFASGALSLAGQITGNKTLSMLGTVAGLGAGVAGMMDPSAFGNIGKGAISQALSGGSDVVGAVNATPVAEVGATVAQTGGMPATEALAAAGPQGVANVGADSSSLVGSVSKNQAGTALAGSEPAANSLGINSNPLAVNNANMSIGNVGSGGNISAMNDIPQMTTDPTNSLVGKVTNQGTSTFGQSGALGGGLLDSIGSSLKGAGKFMQENDKLISAAGNAMKYFDEDDLKDAQAKLYEARTRGDNATAAIYEEKLRQMQDQAANANSRGANALGTNTGLISSVGANFTNRPTRTVNQYAAGRA